MNPPPDGRRRPKSSKASNKARAAKNGDGVFFHDAAHSLREADALTDPPGSPIQAPPAEFGETDVQQTVAYIEAELQSDQNSLSDSGQASLGAAGDGSSAVSSDNANFSASERVISGSAWSIVSTVFTMVVFMLRGVALARLLSTDAFGLVALSVTVHGAINALTNFGLSNTIVSKKFDSDAELHAQLNTIWTLDLIRRAAITVVLISLSYPIARFYNDMRLTSILVITCISLTTEGFNNVGLLLLRREVKWKQATIYDMLSALSVTVITILVALWRRDAYALAWGQMVASLFATALSYLYHPYRPRFQIDRGSVQKSSKTGAWFLVIGITVYITTSVDNVFVGKLLGSAALGIYAVAYAVSAMPQGIISRVISFVMFPVVAALNRNEDERLGPMISRVMNVSISFLALLMVPLAVLAPEVIAIYGPKWHAAVVPLRILLLTGLFRGLLQNISPIMIGMDRPDLEARSKIVEVVLFVSALWILVPRYGINGAAWASVLSYLLSVILRYRYAMMLVPNGFKLLPQQIMAMLGAAAGGTAAGFLVLWPIGGAPIVVRLVVGTAAIWAVTVTLLLTLRPELRDELERFGVRKRLNQILGRA